MVIFHLKNLLKQQHLSQNEFARMTGIRPNTINDIANNKMRRIEVVTLNKILKAIIMLGYTVSDLIEYKE